MQTFLEEFRQQKAGIERLAGDVGIERLASKPAVRLCLDFAEALLLCLNDDDVRRLMRREKRWSQDFLSALDAADGCIVAKSIEADGEHSPNDVPYFLAASVVLDMLTYFDQNRKR